MDLHDKPVVPEELIVITVRGPTAKLPWSSDRGKTQHQRRLTKDEVDSIRRFITKEQVDQLPILGGTRIVDGKEERVVGGTIQVYLHLTPKSGRRLLMNNPPTRGLDKYPPDEPIWKYAKVGEFFRALKRPK